MATLDDVVAAIDRVGVAVMVNGLGIWALLGSQWVRSRFDQVFRGK